MLYAISGLLLLSLALNAYVFWLCSNVLKSKDELAYKEREQILQRIQSPISAVAVHAQEKLDDRNDTGQFTLPFDDDAAMQDFLGSGEVNGL